MRYDKLLPVWVLYYIFMDYDIKYVVYYYARVVTRVGMSLYTHVYVLFLVALFRAGDYPPCHMLHIANYYPLGVNYGSFCWDGCNVS